MEEGGVGVQIVGIVETRPSIKASEHGPMAYYRSVIQRNKANYLHEAKVYNMQEMKNDA